VTKTKQSPQPIVLKDYRFLDLKYRFIYIAFRYKINFFIIIIPKKNNYSFNQIIDFFGTCVLNYTCFSVYYFSHNIERNLVYKIIAELLIAYIIDCSFI